jgi:hypothetical protein
MLFVIILHYHTIVLLYHTISNPPNPFFPSILLAEMWGETADGSDVLQTIFPRAAAAAERQWSYDVVTNSSDPSVLPRMQNFRCFMLERGVASAPVNNANAREAPPGPGSCFQ